MKGEIKYVVFDSCDPRIESLDKAETSHVFSELSLKLLSFSGEDDGTLSCRLNRYSDGSGHDETVKLCKTLEEAKEILKEFLDNRNLSESRLKIYQKYGFEIPKENLELYIKNSTESYQKIIENKKGEIQEYKEKIKALKKI